MHHHNKPRANIAKTIITTLTPQLQQSYNSILNELHDYTLTQPFMDNALSLQVNNHLTTSSFSSVSSVSSFSSIKEPKQTIQSSINSDEPPLIPSLKPDLLIPSQKDTLFWCFYIMKHGLNAYTTIGNKHFQIEQEEKIAAIEFLRTKKELLKTHKIKPFTSIESDLSPGSTINIKTFFALAVCYDLRAVYIYKNTYIDNLDINNDNDNGINNGNGSANETAIHMIQWARPNEYAFVYDPSQWSSLCFAKYKWQSIDKPVGAASLYKITDILELFNKLQIPTNNANTVFHLTKKPTKKEMYDAILAYFM